MYQTLIVLPKSAKVMLRNRCYRRVDSVKPGDKLLYKTVPKFGSQIDSYALLASAEPVLFNVPYNGIKTNMWHSDIIFTPMQKLLLQAGGHKRVKDLKEGDRLVTPYHGHQGQSLEYEYGYIVGTIAFSGYNNNGNIVIYFEESTSMEKFKEAWKKIYNGLLIVETKPASVYKIVIEKSPILLIPGEIIEQFCYTSIQFGQGILDSYKHNKIVNASQELYELYVWASSSTGKSTHNIVSVEVVQVIHNSVLLILDLDSTRQEVYLCVNNCLLLV